MSLLVGYMTINYSFNEAFHGVACASALKFSGTIGCCVSGGRRADGRVITFSLYAGIGLDPGTPLSPFS